MRDDDFGRIDVIVRNNAYFNTSMDEHPEKQFNSEGLSNFQKLAEALILLAR